MKTRWKLITALLGAAGMANAAFVTIGDAGNTADTTGYGAVDYEYKISATEVTIAEFLASGAGDGDEGYWNDGTRTVGTAAPASMVSVYEAMKYCNWLTSGNVNSGVYTFSGGTYVSTMSRAVIMAGGLDAVATDPNKIYALPTEDEWHKAAYYTGSGYSDYANGDDVGTAPTHGTVSGWNYYDNGYVNSYPNYTWTTGFGGEEQNGTFDMMGNVFEWMEDSAGVIRGGSYNYLENKLHSSNSDDYDPSTENRYIGFRVVAVPESATMGLLALAGGFALLFHRRFAA